jgi:hypothetical protein
MRGICLHDPVDSASHQQTRVDRHLRNYLPVHKSPNDPQGLVKLVIDLLDFLLPTYATNCFTNFTAPGASAL